MSPTIRNLILNYLHLNISASVTELASALSVTPQDIRYNLKPLIEENLIEKYTATPRVNAKGRGRPAARLRLTVKTKPNNYPALAAALLKEYVNESSNLPENAAAKLANLVFTQSTQNTGSLMQDLSSMIQVLNQHQYQAHWEAHASGPRIIFENCPYAEILPSFPLLCGMDREFLRQRTKMQADQLQRFDKSPRKPPICLFSLGSRSQR